MEGDREGEEEDRDLREEVRMEGDREGEEEDRDLRE